MNFTNRSISAFPHVRRHFSSYWKNVILYQSSCQWSMYIEMVQFAHHCLPLPLAVWLCVCSSGRLALLSACVLAPLLGASVSLSLTVSVSLAVTLSVWPSYRLSVCPEECLMGNRSSWLRIRRITWAEACRGQGNTVAASAGNRRAGRQACMGLVLTVVLGW